jgi:hypothetical protein
MREGGREQFEILLKDFMLIPVFNILLPTANARG